MDKGEIIGNAFLIAALAIFLYVVFIDYIERFFKNLRIKLCRLLAGEVYSIMELEKLWREWYISDEVEMFNLSGLTFPGHLKKLKVLKELKDDDNDSAV